MVAYRIFTVSSGRVEAGVQIDALYLKGAGISIPAVIIGEEGRGRERGVVPISNPPQVPCAQRGKVQSRWGSTLLDPGTRPKSFSCDSCGVDYTPWEEYEDRSPIYSGGVFMGWRCVHPDAGMVQGRLMFAEVGTTAAGKPKLFSAREATTDEKVIVVFRTYIGFRGGNSHTGDSSGKDENGLKFHPFPGEVLVKGTIAQGIAGYAGSGHQMVAVMPKDAVFRTGYDGRLYGAPPAHYYKWDGQQLLALTWEERQASDLF